MEVFNKFDIEKIKTFVKDGIEIGDRR